MAGTIAADTLTHSTAGSLATNFVVEGSAKGFVYFNGGRVSGSVSIYESFNKSSIADNATADYTVTATSNMSGTQYVVTSSANCNTGGYVGLRNESAATATMTASTERYYGGYGGGFQELNFGMTATFGELA